MSNYAEKNLYENEWIVESAKRDRWGLVGWWILGILFFWLLFIPTIIAVKKTVQYCYAELTVTTKRIVYKTGVFHTQAFDAPLDKIYNVYLEAGFWGRIFNVYKIRIHTAYGVIVERIANGAEFKSLILGQIDQFQEERLQRQANWTAQAMASTAQQKQAERRKVKRRVSDYEY